MTMNIEEFLREEPWATILIGDRRLYWYGHEWAVVRIPYGHQLPISILYEGPLLSEALNCLRTGRPY